MIPKLLVKVLSVLTVLLAPTASATYYYDTKDIQQRVITQAKRQNVDPSLALAIAKVESNFNPKALSHAGAKGVMQIMPQTAEQVFGVHRNRLFDPDVNIELGVKFIKKLIERYNGRLDIALSHYNGGSGVKNSHGELKVMAATRHYVDKVLSSQQDFLSHAHLQQNHRPFYFASRSQGVNQSANQGTNQSGIIFTDTHIGATQADTPELVTHREDPQIETLRALRLHNITRNYKSKSARPYTGKPTNFIKSPSVQVSQSAKRKKVRQWESIYLD